jgi:hypothetical protein
MYTETKENACLRTFSNVSVYLTKEFITRFRKYHFLYFNCSWEDMNL